MDNYKLYTVEVGVLLENCYILLNNDTKECVLIDPGDEPGKILTYLKKLDAKPCAILVTHAHHDHIGAIPDIMAAYPGLTYMIGADEKELMGMESGHELGIPIEYLGEPAKWLDDADVEVLAGIRIQTIATPGHTKGSVCYSVPDIGILFSGDTLFRGSYGRTDLATGDPEQIGKSLMKLFENMDDNMTVYPGHDAYTNIGFEKKYNLWFSGR